MAIRHWAFTLNNYGSVDIELLRTLSETDTVQVMVVGREVGESGTPHLQGHIGFSAPRRMSAVRALFAGRNPHLEPARDVEASIRYCRKSGDVAIDIDKRSPGRRTDIERLICALDEGGLMQARQDCPQVLIRYPAGAKLLCSLADCPDRNDFRVLCFIGPAGCGKSMAARTYSPYSWTSGGDWFDGYNGEATILLDDFQGDKSGLTLGLFLRLADRGQLRLPIKGSMVVARHTTLIITSNNAPHTWYPMAHMDAIDRRTWRDLGTTYTHPQEYPKLEAPAHTQVTPGPSQ